MLIYFLFAEASFIFVCRALDYPHRYVHLPAAFLRLAN